MAELTPDVMFTTENSGGADDLSVAALNFELMDVLGGLVPGSPVYRERAKLFHAEVAARRGRQ